MIQRNQNKKSVPLSYHWAEVEKIQPLTKTHINTKINYNEITFFFLKKLLNLLIGGG